MARKTPNDESYGSTVSDDPLSLYQKCPRIIQMALEELPDRFLRKTEYQLSKDAEYEKDDALAILRVNLFGLYNESLELGLPIAVTDLIRGACSYIYLTDVVLQSNAKVAYLITPPKSLKQMQELILRRGLAKLRDMVELDPIDTIVKRNYDQEGELKSETVTRKINSSLLKEKRETVQMLNDRVNGTLVQKLAVATNAPLPGKGPSPKSLNVAQKMAAIDAELSPAKNEETLDV